jgi:hypothetical protein
VDRYSQSGCICEVGRGWAIGCRVSQVDRDQVASLQKDKIRVSEKRWSVEPHVNVPRRLLGSRGLRQLVSVETKKCVELACSRAMRKQPPKVSSWKHILRFSFITEV